MSIFSALTAVDAKVGGKLGRCACRRQLVLTVGACKVLGIATGSAAITVLHFLAVDSPCDARPTIVALIITAFITTNAFAEWTSESSVATAVLVLVRFLGVEPVGIIDGDVRWRSQHALAMYAVKCTVLRILEFAVKTSCSGRADATQSRIILATSILHAEECLVAAVHFSFVADGCRR